MPEPDHKHHHEPMKTDDRTHSNHSTHSAGHAPSEHDARNAHDAHDKHAGHDPDMFRTKFWLSLVLTVPILVWGHMLPSLLGLHAPAFPGSRWIAPVLGTFVFVYGGWPFLQGAGRELKVRRPGMMTLISLAISVAFVFSVATLVGLDVMPLWEELATLVTIMLLGHWMEMRSITRAQGALHELAKLLPSTATVLHGDHEMDVPISKLREGDVVLVRPGARIPADGSVDSGRSAVDESMLTGESRLVEKAEGAEVKAGTVNRAGALRVRVTGTGEQTALAGIMRLVQDAQSSRSRAQALADRAAAFLTFVALGSAILTIAAWTWLQAQPNFIIERVVTVLVIACPHALGLAVPLVVAISTSKGAQNGLLVRDRRGLEGAREIKTVVFDKTGTLTLGEHRVVALRTAGDRGDAEVLRIAAAIQRDSEHPIAKAVVASARERGLEGARAEGFESLTGRGVRGTVDGRVYASGGPNLLRELDVSVPPELESFAQEAADRGQGVTYLIDEGAAAAVAAFAIADAVRPESREAVQRLRDLGLDVVMMTGDSRAVAQAVAAELGIDTVLAEVLPERKSAEVRTLQAQGKRVMMVGDGVNDAPALVAADVGVAIGAGTDVAVEAGDVVLVRSDPRDVARIIKLSRATYRKMVQNLWWAAGYNIVAIPLAAGVLAGVGILLHPAVGALLMSASTIVVALNAQLLRAATV